MNILTYPSPVGRILLESDGSALTGLWLDREEAGEENADEVLRKAAAWLDEYFRGEDRPPDFDLAPRGTAFQKLVWQLLLDIPWGHTRTYGALAGEAARMLGKEKMSAQAVGQAVGANPIAILIPCHRCVGAGGKLGGYAYGIEKKRWLLDHERKNDNAVCENP